MKNPSDARLKAAAKSISKALKSLGIEIAHHQARQLAATLAGEPNLHALKTKLGKTKAPSKAPKPPKDPEATALEAWIAKAKNGYTEKEIVAKKVRIHRFICTILTEDDEEAASYDPSMEQAAYDINEGSAIGWFEKASERTLLPTEVVPCLLEIQNDGTFFEEPFELPNPEKLIYLTNALGELCDHIPAITMEALGLPWDEMEDSPLTEKEYEQLCEEIQICGHMFLANYTALQHNRKWHCPTCEIPYQDPFWGEGHNFPTEKEAKMEAERLMEELLRLNRHHGEKGGEILIENDIPGRICVIIKRPLE